MGKKYSGGIEIATGFKKHSPQPITDDEVVVTFADLEELEFKYQGMTVYVEDENKDYQYNGDSWQLKSTVDDTKTNEISSWSSKKISEGLSLKVDKAEGKDLSSNDFTAELKNKLEGISFLDIYVSAIWKGVGLVFDVVADSFPINGNYFSATPTEVTLDASHLTLDRIDLIVAKRPEAPAIIGTITKINGTPASSELVVPPDYDSNIYYVIKQVTVKAAEAAPDGFSNTDVFQEGIEWVYLTSPNVNRTSTDPQSGTYSIEGTNTEADEFVLFGSTELLSTADLSIITFYVKLKEFADKNPIQISFLLNGSLVKSYILRSTNHGFDDKNLSYQRIYIDKSYLMLPPSNYNGIRISFTGESNGYFIDNVVIHSGSGSEAQEITNFPEAPIDDKIYGRKNGFWEEIIQNFTEALKANYDSAVSWISTNGVNLINHLSNKSNPHEVTKSQVGLGSVPNTDFTSAVAANTAKTTNAIHTGDVTGSTTLTITNKVVTNDKLADVPTNTFKGRLSTGTGEVEDLTGAQMKVALGIGIVLDDYENIYFQALSPDFAVITRSHDFKVTEINEYGGVMTILTASDVAYVLNDVVSAGNILKVYADTVGMRASLKIEKI